MDPVHKNTHTHTFALHKPRAIRLSGSCSTRSDQYFPPLPTHYHCPKRYSTARFVKDKPKRGGGWWKIICKDYLYSRLGSRQKGERSSKDRSSEWLRKMAPDTRKGQRKRKFSANLTECQLSFPPSYYVKCCQVYTTLHTTTQQRRECRETWLIVIVFFTMSIFSDLSVGEHAPVSAPHCLCMEAHSPQDTPTVLKQIKSLHKRRGDTWTQHQGCHQQGGTYPQVSTPHPGCTLNNAATAGGGGKYTQVPAVADRVLASE